MGTQSFAIGQTASCGLEAIKRNLAVDEISSANPPRARPNLGPFEFLLGGVAPHRMSATPPRHYTAAAVGKSSGFDVEIDVAVDDTEIHMSIATRTWTFRFALSARDDVARILSFLREHTGRLEFSEIVVGSFHDAPVRLIKDDEFADRFWLRAYGGGPMVEFVLAAGDLTEFTDTIAQAFDDLQS